MRKIKFRAWDFKNKMMREVKSLYFPFGGNKTVVVKSLDDDTDEWLDTDIVMQFTGLRDKNGREIYEGDICKIRHYLDGRKFINGEVKYDDGVYVVDVIDMQVDLHCLVSSESMFIEVVGNIYENPELLMGAAE